MPQPAHASIATRQRGVALFIVIVFVMLAMLLALWASRTALFNEMVVGNDADYQRAFEAAQALLQDAELDIRGERADGTQCDAAPCRAHTGALQFPGDTAQITPLLTLLADVQRNPTRCRDALCARRVGRQDFWNHTAQASATPPANVALGERPLPEMLAVGARYGQYTGAANSTAAGQLSPILAERAAGQGGWYWIEIMRYSDQARNTSLIVDAPAGQLALNLDVPVVFRITALAKGLKPGTTAVLQQTYARARMKD